MKEKDIDVTLRSNLIEVNADKREATFQNLDNLDQLVSFFVIKLEPIVGGGGRGQAYTQPFLSQIKSCKLRIDPLVPKRIKINYIHLDDNLKQYTQIVTSSFIKDYYQ